jgi:hypothetical protein
MKDSEAAVEPLDEDQRRRAQALALAADLGRSVTPLGRSITKFTVGELTYLADHIIYGSADEAENTVLLPRELAVHAVQALAMSPDLEDQACARWIEAALNVDNDDDDEMSDESS